MTTETKLTTKLAVDAGDYSSYASVLPMGTQIAALIDEKSMLLKRGVGKTTVRRLAASLKDKGWRVFSEY